MINQIDSSNPLQTPQDVQSFVNKLTQEQRKSLLQELQKNPESIADMPISEDIEKVDNYSSLYKLPPGEFGDSKKPIFRDYEEDSIFACK